MNCAGVALDLLLALAPGKLVRLDGDAGFAVVAADEARPDPAVLASADLGFSNIGRDGEEHAAREKQVGGPVGERARVKRPPGGAVPILPGKRRVGRLVGGAERRPSCRRGHQPEPAVVTRGKIMREFEELDAFERLQLKDRDGRVFG